MAEGEILESERKGKILSFGGYLYKEHSKNGDRKRTYWMCRRRSVCKVRATETPTGISDLSVVCGQLISYFSFSRVCTFPI